MLYYYTSLGWLPTTPDIDGPPVYLPAGRYRLRSSYSVKELPGLVRAAALTTDRRSAMAEVLAGADLLPEVCRADFEGERKEAAWSSFLHDLRAPHGCRFYFRIPRNALPVPLYRHAGA
jgi:hypothetical protein